MQSDRSQGWPMRWWCAGLIVSATVLACSGPHTRGRPDSPPDPAVVQTDTGQVRGTILEDHRSFQGIPYAAPPVGAYRWHAPQPALPWTDVFDATRSGPPCPQAAAVFADVNSLDEDCLSLNITVPATASPDSMKPVMVWFHGGSGANGAGSFFGARRLAVTGDVVVVTVNYRLGIFGAFGYPGLNDSGTFGMQDQQAALRWVQRNIAAFGGDPTTVTVFGESYGAYSVFAHLIAPGSAGLFHRAILQSNLALHDYPAGTLMPGVEAIPSLWLPVTELAEVGRMIADEAGCSGSADALACLRALPVDRLLPSSSIFTRYAYGSAILPEDPIAAFQSGRFHRVPVLSGATRDEARLYVALFYDLAGMPVTVETYPDLLATAFGDAADRVAAEYPLEQYPSPSVAWATVVTDSVWALPTMEQHELLAAHVPTYAFEFADRAAPPNVPFPDDFPPGAYHNAEVAYQFTVAGEEAPLSTEQWRLAEAMNQYWATFARTGDPNGAGLPTWPAFDPRARVPHVHGLAPGATGIAPVEYRAEHHLAFWEQLRK